MVVNMGMNDLASIHSYHHTDVNNSDVEQVNWLVPGGGGDDDDDNNNSNNTETASLRRQQQRHNRSNRCIELAKTCTHDFDSSFDIYNNERECSVPQFHVNEIILPTMNHKTTKSKHNDQQHMKPSITRVSGFYKEYTLHSIEPTDKKSSKDSGSYRKAKQHFIAQRKVNHDYEYYTIKYLQVGLLESSDHGPNAVTEMMIEIKILSSLAQHPNIIKIHGITSCGIDAIPRHGIDGYFFMTDRISESLSERIEQWRKQQQSYHLTPTPTNPDFDITKRLEVALDIASALIFLHDRKIVYYIRPDKVGFDLRHNVIKLCYFGQSRQIGMESHPRTVTQSDNMDTLAYTAPEVFCLAPAYAASDVYGFGVLLWEMMSLQRPFRGYDRARHYEDVIRNHVRPLSVNDDWDIEIAQMMQKCWKPYQRPTMKAVHVALETRLLYQEPSSEILDTARIIQRRHSEGMLEELKNESKNFAINNAIQLSSQDIPISISDKNDSKILLKDDPSDLNKSKLVPNHMSLERSQSITGLSASSSSILSGISLDEILQDVSDAMSGDNHPPDREIAPSHRRRSQSKQVQSRTRRRSRTLKNNASTKLVTHPDANVSLSSINFQHDKRRDTDNDFDSVDNDDEDLIASIISQSDLSIRNGHSYSSLTTNEHDQNLAAKSKYPQQMFNASRAEIRKSTSSAIRAKSPKSRPRRSKSRGHDLNRSSTLADILDTVPMATPPSSPPMRKMRLKLSPSTVVAQNATRTTRHSSPAKTGDDNACPDSGRARMLQKYGRSNSDGSLGIRRNRRASIAEVKQKFDFVPDTPKQRPPSDTLRILKKSLESASPIKSPGAERRPSSPTKAIANVGKRILRGVFRIGSDKDVGVDEEYEQPVQNPRQAMRRGSSSLVLDIVKQQKEDEVRHSTKSSRDRHI